MEKRDVEEMNREEREIEESRSGSMRNENRGRSRRNESGGKRNRRKMEEQK